jgi:putative FmdB family regulatory protein
MPIYEYVCRACGGETELMQKISDPPARKCPACGKSKLVKQVSAARFRLAGSGWYETDFKKAGDKTKNLVGDKTETKPAEAKVEAKADTAAEKKPEKKAEGKKAESRKSESKSESKKSEKKAAATPSP